jgi:lysophospholipase L1-like esterase
VTAVNPEPGETESAPASADECVSWRSRGRRALLALAGSAVAVAAAELVLSLLGFSFHLYPTKIEFGSPTPQEIDSWFIADRDLFWVTKDYFAKLDVARETQPSMVFMGDSCTDWGQYDTLFGRLIERDFPEAKYTHASFGTPAWTTYQGLRQFERDVLPLKPRVVSVQFGWNDHWRGLGIEDKDVANVSSSKLFELQKHSRLAQLIAKAYVGLTHDADRPLLRVSPEDFRSNLTQMARLAKENAITLVLMTAPTSHQRGREPKLLEGRHMDDLTNLVPVHQQYVGIVREVAQREGVVLCDLAKVFEGFERERLLTQLFLEDGIHQKAEADQIIADELYRSLEQRGLLSLVLR